MEYKVTATESMFDLFVGNDDHIAITSDPAQLVVMSPPTPYSPPDAWMYGEMSAHSNGVYKMVVFDPTTGNMYNVLSFDPDYYSGTPAVIQAKMMGRFRQA